MIIWDVEIIVLDLVKRAVSVSATRIDGADPDNPKTYTVPRAIVGTEEQQLAVINEIWDNYQAALTKQGQIDNVIGNLESQAESILEGKENG